MRWRGDWQNELQVDAWWTTDLGIIPEVRGVLHPPSLRLVHSLGGKWAQENYRIDGRYKNVTSLRTGLISGFWLKIHEFLDHLRPQQQFLDHSNTWKKKKEEKKKEKKRKAHRTTIKTVKQSVQ